MSLLWKLYERRKEVFVLFKHKVLTTLNSLVAFQLKQLLKHQVNFSANWKWAQWLRMLWAQSLVSQFHGRVPSGSFRPSGSSQEPWGCQGRHRQLWYRVFECSTLEKWRGLSPHKMFKEPLLDMRHLKIALILSLSVTLLITIECPSFLICTMGEDHARSISQVLDAKAFSI